MRFVKALALGILFATLVGCQAPAREKDQVLTAPKGAKAKSAGPAPGGAPPVALNPNSKIDPNTWAGSKMED